MIKRLQFSWILLFLFFLLLVGVGVVAYATWQIQRHFLPQVATYSAQDLGNKAKDQLDAGNYATAENYLQQALQKQDDRTYRSQLAVVEYRLKKYPQSITEYKRLIANQQDVAFAENGVGNANRDWGEGHYAEAEAAYRASFMADKQYVAAYSNLALLLRSENNVPEAMTVLSTGITATTDPGLVKLKTILAK